MITLESIMSISKSDIQEASKVLNKDDVPQLVEWLSLKDDNIRYQAFLLLQNRSLFFITNEIESLVCQICCCLAVSISGSSAHSSIRKEKSSSGSVFGNEILCFIFQISNITSSQAVYLVLRSRKKYNVIGFLWGKSAACCSYKTEDFVYIRLY